MKIICFENYEKFIEFYGIYRFLIAKFKNDFNNNQKSSNYLTIINCELNINLAIIINNKREEKNYPPSNMKKQNQKAEPIKKVGKVLQTSQPQKFVHKSLLGQYQKMIFRKNYFVTIGGFLLGMKICDLIFYNPRRLQVIREQMQDQFWATHGEPKNLKPQIVQSFVNPTKMRNSWIQIVLGKDNDVPKAQE